MNYTISKGEYKGTYWIPDIVRISDIKHKAKQSGHKTGKNIQYKTKESILRIVETGEIIEFDSRSDMCDYIGLAHNSLSKYVSKAVDGIITIRKKQYEVIK